jgi:hypothetical protein
MHGPTCIIDPPALGHTHSGSDTANHSDPVGHGASGKKDPEIATVCARITAKLAEASCSWYVHLARDCNNTSL